jgi:hypothetical protein
MSRDRKPRAIQRGRMRDYYWGDCGSIRRMFCCFFETSAFPSPITCQNEICASAKIGKKWLVAFEMPRDAIPIARS